MVFSWIFGTAMLSSLMILYNNMQLKRDIKGIIFFFIMTVLILSFNIHKNDNILGMIFFNQLYSVMTVLLALQIKKDMNKSDKFENFPKFSNLFSFNMNSFFILSLYFSIYFIIYK
jgi:hypothetical protein